MTTDTELRDLLTREATGPATHPAGWDDVVRRGHHHRRVTRLRNGLALGSLAAVVAITALAVGDPDGDDRRPVVANDPDGSSSVPDTTASTVGSLARSDLGSSARVQGAFVTVLTAPADPPAGIDPCQAWRPRVIETPDQVVVELVDASLADSEPWAGCQASAFSGHGTIELTDPLGDRRLVDGWDAAEITVVDGAPLLFPTELPAPFDVERWDEFAGIEESGLAWTFSFSADDMALNVSRKLGPPQQPECGVELVQVRGVTGGLCQIELAADLSWTDADGVSWEIELAGVSGDALPEGIDLVAIAEGLEPLGG